MRAADARKGKFRYAYAYAHRGDGDMFAIAVGENLPRLRKAKADGRARGPIEVIAGTQEAFDALSRASEERYADCAARCDRAERNCAAQRADVRAREDMLEALGGASFADHCAPHFVLAAQQVEEAKKKLAVLEATRSDLAIELEAIAATIINGPGLLRLLEPLETKLAVLGHGAAGCDSLSADNSFERAFTLRAVARNLRAKGLHRDIASVRLPPCESADAKTRTAFESDPPARWWRFAKTRAPAQILADEMSRAGFAEPRVTGYQGSGWMTPPGRTAMRQLGSLPGEEGVRRSEVAKIFVPRPRRLLPCI